MFILYPKVGNYYSKVGEVSLDIKQQNSDENGSHFTQSSWSNFFPTFTAS